LRNFYAEAGRLDIQRISGEPLRMEQCYINLAIVEHSLLNNVQNNPETQTNQKSSPFSLFSRLKVEKVDSGSQVCLKSLFDPRKQSEGKVIKPRRILIRGRAGVGKTTLCKKIVSEFLNHGMWKGLFDLLLWVPLRNLKLKSSPATYNMENLFYDEYFSQHPDGYNLARAMWISINKSPAREKTLFLLDGLDEVHGQWGSETPMHKFLEGLLKWPQVIITSRPQTLNRNNLEPPDLELETIGFLQEQVMAYIEKVHDRPIADQIQAFIHSRWLIQGLVRIPIQLDALCYSWSEDFHADGGPKNMTTLYEAIGQKLWKKDILRLGKSYNRKLLTEDEVSSLRTKKQIERLVQDEVDFLESLAFSGLYNNIIDFDANYRDQIMEILPSDGIFFSDNVLAKVSFLRTSDSALKDKEKSYHFLHLTFQEFFAASYFIRQWMSNQQLFCFTIGSNSANVEPREFLRKEKYNARYDIFWRFVTGLLQSRQEEKPLLQFFQLSNAG
jgi:predicted NACHT family NTPase